MPRAGKRAQALLGPVRPTRPAHFRRLHGFACPSREAAALSGQALRGLLPAPVGVVSQSGGTFEFWLQQARCAASIFPTRCRAGNELDLDLADYINFLIDDEHTKIIVCLVEGIRRPQALMAAAEKALAAGKPILLVKVGRSERGRLRR